jgi:hypothetical protein
VPCCKQTIKVRDSLAGPQKCIEQRLEEMRAVLAERRDHLPLWHAYGQQLYKAGQAKVTTLALAAQHPARPPSHLFAGLQLRLSGYPEPPHAEESAAQRPTVMWELC